MIFGPIEDGQALAGDAASRERKSSHEPRAARIHDPGDVCDLRLNPPADTNLVPSSTQRRVHTQEIHVNGEHPDHDEVARFGFFPFVRGNNVRLQRAGSTIAMAQGNLSIERAGSQLMLAGGDVSVTQGGAQAVLAKGDIEITQGGAVVAGAHEVSVSEGVVGIAGAHAVGVTGSRVGIAVGRNVEINESTVLFGSSAAMATGAAIGFLVGLLLRSLGRR
ncbi:MAG: hypothetical protein GY925_21195 [Actinomycetia bacterium]|nr:hypothetical protein [Actinomycetes bacterium]